MSPQSIKRYIKLHNQNDQIIILMSKILMQPRLNNDQNSDVENFDFKLRPILMSEILMRHIFDHDHNPDVKIFYATQI
jgi:hypothetical protein